MNTSKSIFLTPTCWASRADGRWPVRVQLLLLLQRLHIFHIPTEACWTRHVQSRGKLLLQVRTLHLSKSIRYGSQVCGAAHYAHFFLLKTLSLLSRWDAALFVFSIDGPKQNAVSLLTPVSNIVLYALSSGTLGSALHGSFNNHLHERIWLAVKEFPPIRKWFKELPWRAKPRAPCERA